MVDVGSVGGINTGSITTKRPLTFDQYLRRARRSFHFTRDNRMTAMVRSGHRRAAEARVHGWGKRLRGKRTGPARTTPKPYDLGTVAAMLAAATPKKNWLGRMSDRIFRRGNR